MSDDQNTNQNQDSVENSIPPSPQEPTEQGTENTIHSEPSDAPSEALESSPNDFSVKSNDIPLPDFTHIEPIEAPKNEEKPRENEPVPEPVSEPLQAIEPLDSVSPPQATAQIPPNEPFSSKDGSCYNYYNLGSDPSKEGLQTIANQGEK